MTIPAHILPKDGRFGSGPSKVRPEQLLALTHANPSLVGTSHRKPPVKNLVAAIKTKMKELLAIPGDYEVIMGNGGASFVWDMISCSVIDKHSHHIVNGEFSSKSAASARKNTLPITVTTTDYSAGAGPKQADISALASSAADTICLTHNETSTGVSINSFLPQPLEHTLCCIDGTSAASALPVHWPTTDLYYFSPQKNFGSDGGLWLAVASPRLVNRLHQIAQEKRWIPDSLSLKLALENSQQNQTLNTPPVLNLLMINDQLDYFLTQGGKEWVESRSYTSSALLYAWAENSSFCTPFVKDPELRSPVVVTIDFTESIDALKIAARLRQNSIVDVEPYRKLGRNQLRIATFASIDPEDVQKLTECIDYVVAHEK